MQDCDQSFLDEIAVEDALGFFRRSRQDFGVIVADLEAGAQCGQDLKEEADNELDLHLVV